MVVAAALNLMEEFEWFLLWKRTPPGSPRTAPFGVPRGFLIPDPPHWGPAKEAALF
jgi:hypothetical protein